MSSAYVTINATTRRAAVIGLLSLTYILSYAPVYRIGRDQGWAGVTDGIAFYRPVDWLIDHTPLQEPLLRWAACWGVRGDFVFGWAARAFVRGDERAEVFFDFKPIRSTRKP